MFRSLLLATLIPAAVGQTLDVFITGDSCTDVFIVPGVLVGTVCGEVVGENLEVKITIAEDVPCCLTESHICNLPAIPFNPFMVDGFCALGFTFAVSIETIYDFVCEAEDDVFTVAGHVAVECVVDMATRRLQGIGSPSRKLQEGMQEITMPNGGVINAMPMATMGMVMPDDPFKFNGYYELGLGCVDSPF